MKNNKFLVIAVICLALALVSVVTVFVIECKPKENIPVVNETVQSQIPAISEIKVDSYEIDEYYTEILEKLDTTVEINDATDQYLEAWDREFKNVISLLKSELKYDEDKEYLDDYYDLYIKLATTTAEIEHLKWVDIATNPSERFAGTGATSSEILAMVEIYKQGTLNLIDYYEKGLENNRTYTFIFNK